LFIPTPFANPPVTFAGSGSQQLQGNYSRHFFR
jgi:hypothetical protein